MAAHPPALLGGEVLGGDQVLDVGGEAGIGDLLGVEFHQKLDDPNTVAAWFLTNPHAPR